MPLGSLAQPDVLVPGPAACAETQWDGALEQQGGHLLQSWRWGEFKARHGWDVERVHVRAGDGEGYAQVLFRPTGPFSIGYVPRGPHIAGDAERVWPVLRQQMFSVSRKHRALSLILEPDDHAVFTTASEERGAAAGPAHVQPACTVKMPLIDDDGMLAGMHHKTRYHVRLASRRGVRIERQSRPSAATLDAFYRLLGETSHRNGFAIHEPGYYRDLMRTFGDRASIFFATIGDRVAVSLLAIAFGEETIYLYGGSSTEHRANGASSLIQFEAAKWARDRGCRRYDLWGIPAQRPEDGEGRSSGDDLSGLYRFKTGFGGDIVRLPATLEFGLVPVMSSLARYVISRRGGMLPGRRKHD